VNARPATSAVTGAIRAGIDYLRRTQLASGEFLTYTGPRPDLAGASPYPKSVYVPAFVVHSLGYVPAEPATDRIRQRAVDFLEAEEEDNGTWNYEGRGEWRLPADLDCTSCAVVALLAVGRRAPRTFYRLLWQVVSRNAAAPGGPYFTYVGVNDAPGDPIAAPFAREVDPLVNANVLFCCGLLGIALPGVTAYLRGTVETESYVGQSFYVVSPHFLAYAISRAYADGGVDDLAPAMPALRTYLSTMLPAPEAKESALNLACRAVALLNLGSDTAEVEPVLVELLRTQQADGSWPAWAAWAGFPPNYDGSPALTTALALEALGKYLKGAGEGR
jgi:hypothetical protein